MGGLFLFYPHYMIMTLETLTHLLVDAEQKKTLRIQGRIGCLWWMSARAPRRSAPLQKRGSQTTDSLLMKFPFWVSGAPILGQSWRILPGRFSRFTGKNRGRCEWIYWQRWQGMAAGLQRHGDHKQKETLHGFPLANSLHILSLLGNNGSEWTIINQ